METTINQSKNWTYNETKALIDGYKNRKVEFFRTRNKKVFWSNVLTDLESLNILVSQTTYLHVSTKWKTLVRAYKQAKDRGTGSTPSKFAFINEIDEIFHGNPIISSTHSVSVGVISNPLPAPMRSIENISPEESAVIEVIEIEPTEEVCDNQNKNKKKKETKKGIYGKIFRKKGKKQTATTSTTYGNTPKK